MGGGISANFSIAQYLVNLPLLPFSMPFSLTCLATPMTFPHNVTCKITHVFSFWFLPISSIWQAFPISTAMTKMAQSVEKAGEKLLSASKKLAVAFNLTLLLSLELWTMVRKKGTNTVS